MGAQEQERRFRDRQVDPEPDVDTNIGALMLEYGGGGHENAGTCRVSNVMAEDVLGALVRRLTSEG